MSYSSRSSICPCLKYITCEICHRQPTLMSHDYVLVKGEIRRDGLTRQEGFRQRTFVSNRCAHDLESMVTVKVTSDQWQHVISRSHMFLVLDGIITNGVIDVTTGESGVMACPDARIKFRGEAVVSCEAFSGGYSGWSQLWRTSRDRKWCGNRSWRRQVGLHINGFNGVLKGILLTAFIQSPSALSFGFGFSLHGGV